jgi:hypothetical protein
VSAMQPLKAIRRHCLWCCNGSANEVALCPARACPLWTMRFGKRPDPAEHAGDVTKLYPLEDPLSLGEFATEGMPTLAAMRRRCLDCSGGLPSEVRSCTHTTCDLWPFRLGRNPNRAGIGRSAEALASARQGIGKPLLKSRLRGERETAGRVVAGSKTQPTFAVQQAPACPPSPGRGSLCTGARGTGLVCLTPGAA